MRLEKADNVKELIQVGASQSFLNSNFYLKDVIKPDELTTILCNNFNILDKYRDVIMKETYEKEFTNDEYQRYLFKPKLLSYDLYGTIELWSLILKVNGLLSVTDFKKSKIIVFNSSIFTVLNEITILERSSIEMNKKIIDKYMD